MGQPRMIEITKSEYKSLQKEIERLNEENESLKDSICDLATQDGQKVIVIHHICDADNDCECGDVEVKGFDECRKFVEESMRYTFKRLEDDKVRNEAKIKSLNGTIASQKQTADALTKKAMEAEMEVSRLKHRNLWQRILNK